LHPYRSLLTTGAIWFKRGDFKFWGGGIDERNFWLFSKSQIDQYEAMEDDQRERSSRIFPDGGQIILRKGLGAEESVMSFDAGSFGYLSIAAHAHADALSLTLSIGGKPILVDPGTYLYHDGGKWRDYFKGTGAHNTIEIDGQDQALSGGPFMWMTRPEVSIDNIILGRYYDYIQASHAGYQRLNRSLRHERSILFGKREMFWIIKDRLVSDSPHQIRQQFHFHPQCRLRKYKGNLFLVTLRSEEPVLCIKMDSLLDTSLHQGEEDPVAGWYSPTFGEKVPAITLKGEKGMQGSLLIKTIIWRF
jgi:hypothetical protein